MAMLNFLETFEYKTPGWSAIEKSNIEKLDAFMAAYSKQERDFGKLVKASATEAQYQAQVAGIWNFIEVNNKFVDLSTELSCIVSGGGAHNLLAADGTDSGSPPSSSTTYSGYVSNADASWSPEELRLSATSPTNGYLGGSGNAANWRYVGDVELDGSTQIAAVTGKVSAVIRDLLALLTGDARLDASAIKNLPEGGAAAWTCWHHQSTPNGFSHSTGTSADRLFHHYCIQDSDSNGDYFEQKVFLEAGTYTFRALGTKSNDYGILDWSMDGVDFETGQDWYYSGNIFNVVQSGTVTISTSGVHTLRGTVNGHNGSSSGYSISLQKYWFEKT